MNTKTLLVLGTLVVLSLAPLNSASAQTWSRTTAPSNTWFSVAISADGSRIIAGNQTSIYTSTNYGSSWISNTAPAEEWLSVASSADGTKLVASDGYIYTNSGTSWAKAFSIASPNYLSPVACSANGNTIMTVDPFAVAVPGALYVSANFGLTWTDATNLPDGVPRWSSLFCSADGTKMAAITTQNSVVASGLFLSANSGATWTSNNIAVANSLAGSQDGKILLTTGTFGCGVSTNGGTNWSYFIITGPPAPMFTNVIACSTNGTVWYGLNHSNIYSTFNSGANWTTNNAPPIAWSALAVSADGTRAVATAVNGGVYVAEPSLAVASATHNVSVLWPTNYPAAEFDLEENTNLATTNWTSAPGSPTVVNQSYQLTLPATNHQLFFRLYSP